MAEQCAALWAQAFEQAHRTELRDACLEVIPEGSQVLEAGCGTGLVARQLSQHYDYTGTDNALPMLAIARNSFPGIAFTEGDLYALPFPDASFDVAVCFEVLGHLPAASVKDALSELRRVSRKAVLVTVWPADSGTVPSPGLEVGGALHNAYGEDYIRECAAPWVTRRTGRFTGNVAAYLIEHRASPG